MFCVLLPYFTSAHYISAYHILQTSQSHSVSRSRGKFFGSRQEKTISGFLVGPPKGLRGSKEPQKDQGEHCQSRDSYSGPLAPVYGLNKVPKGLDHSSTLSAKSNSSTLSNLVASRTGDGNQDTSGPLMPNSLNKVSMFSRPINSMEALVRRQDSKFHSGRNADIASIGEAKVSAKESSVVMSSICFLKVSSFIFPCFLVFLSIPMKTEETRCTSQAHSWVHRTMWKRCSRIMIEGSKHSQGGLGSISQGSTRIRQQISMRPGKCWGRSATNHYT